MKLIQCNFQQHGNAILEIFNEVIQNSTALYESELRTLSVIEHWFADKSNQQRPILGMENDQHELMGFSSFGPFRPQPAMRLTCEHSLYVRDKFRGYQVGKSLLKELLAYLKEQQFHTTVAAIDSENTGCIELHKKMGFLHQGRIKQAAKKFDRWCDLDFYQLIF